MGLSRSLSVKIGLKTDAVRTNQLKTELSLLEQETWRTNEWEENSIKALKRGRLNFKQTSWRTREGYWTVIVIKRENLKVRNYWHHKN